MPETTVRPIHEIAAEIKKVWPKPYFGAKPYLDAMASLSGVNDFYFADSASEICIRFLCNATTWRGDDARRIKKELKSMFGVK